MIGDTDRHVARHRDTERIPKTPPQRFGQEEPVRIGPDVLGRGALERPFEAYEGDEPYVFVCYSHDDKALVYPELVRLKDSGFHLWYDEGISPGSEWSDAIAKKIEHSAIFLYFITPRSVISEHCRREVSFALGKPCRMLSVHLVPTQLPSGLALTLSNRQAILKHDEPRAVYEAKLARAIDDARTHHIDGTSTPERPLANATRPRPIRWFAAAALLMAIAVGLSVWFANRPAQQAPLFDRSLAVVSFAVVGAGADVTTYAEALTEELRNAVTQYQELRIVARPDTANPRDVTDASYVIGGNVQRIGGSMRIRANLTRTDDHQTVWAETFERAVTDETADPTETATTIARFIRAQLVQDQRCESVRRTARNEEAATAFCAASAEVFRFSRMGDWDNQLLLSSAKHAIALDPDIVGAHGMVAFGYRVQAVVGAMDWRTAARHADDALARGLALAPGDAELLMQRGWVQGWLELNYPAAEASLQASLLSNPLGPSAGGSHLMLGNIASARGDLGVALDQGRRVLRIDDSTAFAHAFYALTLWNAGQNREAIKVADTGLDLIKNGGVRFSLLSTKALAHNSLGETAAANAALDDALASVGPALKPRLAGALAQVGRTEEARQLVADLESLEPPPIEPLVAAYAALQDDRAFALIHRAIDQHVWGIVSQLRVNPVYSELRQDARWAEVMKHLEAEESRGGVSDQGSK